MNISDKIRLARRETETSQEELANLVGVSLPTIARWEIGAVDKISIEHVERIARALRKPLDYFLKSGEDLESERKNYISDLSQWGQKVDIYKLRALVDFIRL